MSYAYAPYPAATVVPQARQSAPPSVHALAIVHYLIGMLELAAAAGLAFLVADGSLSDRSLFLDHPDAARLAYAGAGAIAVVALITMTLGRKLQRGRQWARILMTIWMVLGIAGTLVTTLHSGEAQAASGLVLPVLYLILLNTRAARSWFRWHTW